MYDTLFSLFLRFLRILFLSILGYDKIIFIPFIFSAFDLVSLITKKYKYQIFLSSSILYSITIILLPIDSFSTFITIFFELVTLLNLKYLSVSLQISLIISVLSLRERGLEELRKSKDIGVFIEGNVDIVGIGNIDFSNNGRNFYQFGNIFVFNEDGKFILKKVYPPAWILLYFLVSSIFVGFYERRREKREEVGSNGGEGEKIRSDNVENVEWNGDLYITYRIEHLRKMWEDYKSRVIFFDFSEEEEKIRIAKNFSIVAKFDTPPIPSPMEKYMEFLMSKGKVILTLKNFLKKEREKLLKLSYDLKEYIRLLQYIEDSTVKILNDFQSVYQNFLSGYDRAIYLYDDFGRGFERLSISEEFLRRMIIIRDFCNNIIKIAKYMRIISFNSSVVVYKFRDIIQLRQVSLAIREKAERAFEIAKRFYNIIDEMEKSFEEIREMRGSFKKQYEKIDLSNIIENMSYFKFSIKNIKDESIRFLGEVGNNLMKINELITILDRLK